MPSRHYQSETSFRFCSRCHRELTDLSSFESGIGPVCAAKSTALFAKAIPANYPAALALLLGIEKESLPSNIAETIETAKIELLRQKRKADELGSLAMFRVCGSDLRGVIEKIDWILSHRIDSRIRRSLIGTVNFLGYIELAAVLSQEASTTTAELSFNKLSGMVTLKGKYCKAGHKAMRQIRCVEYPKWRGDESPYKTIASKADLFLDVVQNFWPMYEIKKDGVDETTIAEIAKEAQEWHLLHPQVQLAQAVLTSSETSPGAVVESFPGAMIKLFETGNRWIVVSFPWLRDRSDEMYKLIGELKTVPYSDRSYDAANKSWRFKAIHRQKVKEIIGSVFSVSEE